MHPTKEGKLYFFADPPHLLKSLRTCLLNNDIILPNTVVAKYNLPTAEVSNSFYKQTQLTTSKSIVSIIFCFFTIHL